MPIKACLSLRGLRRHLQTPLYANAYYLMANTAVNSLSGFVFWTIVARLYAPEDVGVASALISALMLLASLASLGLGTGLIRFLPNAGERAGDMLGTSLTVVVPVSLLASVAFLAGLPVWSPALTFLYDQPIALVGFVVFSVLSALDMVIRQVFVARRTARFTLLCSAITSALKMVGPVLPAVSSLGAMGIVASVGIAIATTLGIALVWLLPRVQNGYRLRLGFRAGILRQLIPYSIGNQVAALLAQTPQVILPILVLNVLGTRASAYSYVTWMLASVLFMISGAVATSTFAEGSNEMESLGDHVRRALGLIALLSLPAILVLVTLGDELLLVFGHEYSEQATGLLTILAFSAIPVGVNNIYIAAKRVEKQTRTIFFLSAFIAAGTLGLSYVLMPCYGVAGTGIGWLVSQGFAMCFVAYSMLRGRRESAGVAPK